MSNLCAHLQYRVFDIYSPRWHDRRVLLKDVKLGEHNKILFTGKDGESMGAEPYYISGKDAKKYPSEMMDTRSHAQVKMRAIPIDSLKLLELTEPCAHLY